MLSAAAIHRWGLRVTVTFGALVGALGWFMVGRAESLTQLYLSYSLLGGIGIGLSTLLPAQTLSVFWFKRYRARATAIILLGAAVVSAVMPYSFPSICKPGDQKDGFDIVLLAS